MDEGLEVLGKSCRDNDPAALGASRGSYLPLEVLVASQLEPKGSFTGYCCIEEQTEHVVSEVRYVTRRGTCPILEHLELRTT